MIKSTACNFRLLLYNVNALYTILICRPDGQVFLTGSAVITCKTVGETDCIIWSVKDSLLQIHFIVWLYRTARSGGPHTRTLQYIAVSYSPYTQRHYNTLLYHTAPTLRETASCCCIIQPPHSETLHRVAVSFSPYTQRHRIMLLHHTAPILRHTASCYCIIQPLYSDTLRRVAASYSPYTHRHCIMLLHHTAPTLTPLIIQPLHSRTPHHVAVSCNFYGGSHTHRHCIKLLYGATPEGEPHSQTLHYVAVSYNS